MHSQPHDTATVTGDLVAEDRTVDLASGAIPVLDIAHADGVGRPGRITVYSPRQARELAAWLLAWAGGDRG
jgi:hypothetical protein